MPTWAAALCGVTAPVPCTPAMSPPGPFRRFEPCRTKAGEGGTGPCWDGGWAEARLDCSASRRARSCSRRLSGWLDEDPFN